MKSQTRQDLLIVVSSIFNDALKEATNGNYDTAQLLSAYAQDIVEILTEEGEQYEEN